MPLIYKGDNYKVILSDNPIFVNLIDTVLKNPFGNKYPVAYSLIFQDNLIALFEPGNFVCYKIPSLERNSDLERKLNTRKFKYQWLLGNNLIAQSDNQTYVLDADFKWEASNIINPLKNQPKLFEDDKYIIFFDCHGEWGGTVYFFNKNTQKTYFTEATCANTITKRDGKYFVLSKLGHMSGSSELKVIENPDNLTIVDFNKTNKTFQGQALGYSDTSKHAKVIFDFYDLQTFSSIPFADKTLYLVNWRQRTFLAEIIDSTISIVNPLFNDDLYTHRPVTTLYDKRALMNLDFYGIAGEREVTSLIVEGNKLIRIDWNEKHNR
ncbi:MAG: hypothetical protein J0L54_08190 [Chitinophagales bacterium]|nr:hypothetical protein [Chitinophagales bacterium]